jgi:hypothetical protein
MCHWSALIAVFAAGLIDGIGTAQASTPVCSSVADQRTLSDPMYLPLAHQFSGATSYSQCTLAEHTQGGGLATVCYIRAIFQYDAFDVRGMDLHVFPTNSVHYAEQANGGGAHAGRAGTSLTATSCKPLRQL